jgi:AcrR family transcriptional regulator
VTVEAVLEAAAMVLARVGFQRATTNLIAEEAGVSIGSLYQYFPSKDAIIAALLDRLFSSLEAEMLSVVARVGAQNPSLPIAARELVRSLLSVYRRDVPLHRVLIEQMPLLGRFDRVLALENQFCAIIRAGLEMHADGVGRRDYDLAAYVVVHAVHSVIRDAVFYGTKGLDEDHRLLDEATALIVGYLEHPAPPA